MDVEVVGVLGAGRMGLALARLLGQAGLDFVFHDTREDALERASRSGYRIAETLRALLEEADAVMVAVGHSEVPKTLEVVGRELASMDSRTPRLVFDIATFKEDIIREYQVYPTSVLVASVHPLFGPGARDPRRHAVAVVPVPGREEGAREASRIFESAGFNVVNIDAETHDELVGYTIGLSYTIAASLAAVLGDRWGLAEKLSGSTFKLLRLLMGAIAVDSEDFIAYVISNEHARAAAARLAEAVRSSAGDPRGSAAKLRELLAARSGPLYRMLYDCIEGPSEAG